MLNRRSFLVGSLALIAVRCWGAAGVAGTPRRCANVTRRGRSGRFRSVSHHQPRTRAVRLNEAPAGDCSRRSPTARVHSGLRRRCTCCT